MNAKRNIYYRHCRFTTEECRITVCNGSYDLHEECHANVGTKDNNGRTPINWASQKGYLEVVKYLH
ncbi:MAG: hypothetical protein IIX06_07715, partial [Bacteroidales bacterium]|nr:hypothetical protein [Bacteroidales bacterium]